MIIDENIHAQIFNEFGFNLTVKRGALLDIIKKLRSKENMIESEVIIAMCSLMSDDIAHEEIQSYLTALHEKGETEEEIAISACMMRIFASKIYNEENKEELSKHKLIDCCGTGGGIHIFNISTAVSFILAAGGLYVAKHGNRAITSQSGSADVLEAMGAKIDIEPQKVGECILKTGLGFLFAPLFHKATMNVQKVRRTLAHKTIFNILGPLTNPAKPVFQVVGVYEPNLTEKMIKVLRLLKIEKAFAVHGFTPCGGGMDEVSTLGQTKVCELSYDGGIKSYLFDAKNIGIELSTVDMLQGGNANDNARLIRGILDGSIVGAQEEIVCLNAAFGFAASNRVNDIQEGFTLAQKLIKDGLCTKVLDDFIQFTKRI